MDTTALQRLVSVPGPFASVYLDVSRDHENAPDEIELRWRELAAQLRAQDADDDTVAAVERTVLDPVHEAGPAGRAVVATHGEVVLDEVLPGPPRRTVARFAPLPHLLPLLAQAPERVPFVQVEVGKEDTTVRVFDAHGTEVRTEHEEEREHPTHKVRGGGLAHHPIQHRVEEIWRDNARSFAKVVDTAVSQVHADLVVVTGDERIARMLVDELSGRGRDIAVRVDDASEAWNLAQQRAAEHTAKAVEDFRIEAGRGSGLAVTGLDDVLHALQLGQVRTLLVRDEPSSDLRVWVGTEPGQLARTKEELAEIGATPLGQDRADAALVRAVAGTGAEIVVLPHPDAEVDPRRAGSASGHRAPPEQPELRDGLGAVLRFSTS